MPQEEDGGALSSLLNDVRDADEKASDEQGGKKQARRFPAAFEEEEGQEASGEPGPEAENGASSPEPSDTEESRGEESGTETPASDDPERKETDSPSESSGSETANAIDQEASSQDAPGEDHSADSRATDDVDEAQTGEKQQDLSQTEKYERVRGAPKERIVSYVNPGVAKGIGLKASLAGKSVSEYVADLFSEMGLHIDDVQEELMETDDWT